MRGTEKLREEAKEGGSHTGTGRRRSQNGVREEAEGVFSSVPKKRG